MSDEFRRRRHLADRPGPSDWIRPASRREASTRRMVWSLTPGTAVRTSSRVKVVGADASIHAETRCCLVDLS